MKIVECVPNFSEGRDTQILDKISAAILAVDGAKLLDVDPGKATNRTVFTFVGEPEVVLEAAFQAIKKASELIDMTKHKGEHPRMGATDVCPFVPVSNVSMKECVELSKKLGERVGKELKIPVYLYENSASCEERRNLANIRQGEYEGLKARFEGEDKEKWAPDFGPAAFNPKGGATAIGAREFLIAYNINLNTKEKKYAHDIALNIREAGRAKKDSNGKIVKDENGKTLMQPGVFKHLKGIGWVIPEYNRAQISMNLTNYLVTPPHLVMEEVRRQALEKGVVITGSEIVGLVPLKAIIDAGKFYLKKMGGSLGAPEKEIVECAIQSLGLNDISKFDPQKRIVEYAMDSKVNKLVNMTTKGFIDELSSNSKAPGGGSVAALDAALSSGLCAMVANLTVGKSGYEAFTETLNDIGERSQKLKDFFIKSIDDDTDAFNEVIAAGKLSKEEKDNALQKATQKAVSVPYNVLQKIPEVLDIVEELIERGNRNSLSDVGVAALTAKSAATGAYMNVIINLSGITDRTFVKEHLETGRKLKNEINIKTQILSEKVTNKLEEDLEK